MFYVKDNVTGKPVSEDFGDETMAATLCRGMNLTGRGGRYGVGQHRWESVTVQQAEDVIRKTVTALGAEAALWDWQPRGPLGGTRSVTLDVTAADGSAVTITIEGDD